MILKNVFLMNNFGPLPKILSKKKKLFVLYQKKIAEKLKLKKIS